MLQILISFELLRDRGGGGKRERDVSAFNLEVRKFIRRTKINKKHMEEYMTRDIQDPIQITLGITSMYSYIEMLIYRLTTFLHCKINILIIQ